MVLINLLYMYVTNGVKIYVQGYVFSMYLQYLLHRDRQLK